MDLPAKFRAVRKALKLDQSEFAVPLKVSNKQISAIENGHSEPSERVLELFFTNYPVNRSWWDSGEGEMFAKPLRGSIAAAEIERNRPEGAYDIPRPSSKIPIVSWTQAGTGGFFEDAFPAGAGFGEINRPFDVSDPFAYALIISGDSMSPKFEPGDIVVVSPAAGVQTGDYAVVKLTDGQVMAKRVREKNSHYVLDSINPSFDTIECPKEKIEFLHRIVWVKQRG